MSVTTTNEKPVFWRQGSDGVSIAVKVLPGAKRVGVGPVVPTPGASPNFWPAGRLRVAVTERAINGRANAAVCALIAAVLGVSPSAVQLAAGAKGREKILHVAGEPARLLALLAAL